MERFHLEQPLSSQAVFSLTQQQLALPQTLTSIRMLENRPQRTSRRCEVEPIQRLANASESQPGQIQIHCRTIIRPLRFFNGSFNECDGARLRQLDLDAELFASNRNCSNPVLPTPCSVERVLSNRSFNPVADLSLRNIYNRSQQGDSNRPTQSVVIQQPVLTLPNLAGSVLLYPQSTTQNSHPFRQIVNIENSEPSNGSQLTMFQEHGRVVEVHEKQGLSLQDLRNLTTIMPYENFGAFDTECPVCFEPNRLRTLTFLEIRKMSENETTSETSSASFLHHATAESPLNSTNDKSSYTFGSSYKTCAICCGEFADGDPLRFINKCNHRYHVVCVDRWFEDNSTCPICRCDLKNITPSGDPQFTSLTTDVADFV